MAWSAGERHWERSGHSHLGLDQRFELTDFLVQLDRHQREAAQDAHRAATHVVDRPRALHLPICLFLAQLLELGLASSAWSVLLGPKASRRTHLVLYFQVFEALLERCNVARGHRRALVARHQSLLFPENALLNVLLERSEILEDNRKGVHAT